MKKLLLATLFMTGLAKAEDHDERRVLLDEVTIKSNKYAAEATLSVKEDGVLALEILMNGKLVLIPERALAPLKNASVETAAFSTETPTGVPVSEWKLKGGIILSFYYGDKITHGMPKNPTDIRAGCRIKISADGNYERIETAISQGQYSNRWRVLVQSKDGMDIRRETVESVGCPIPMRWNRG